MASPPEVEAENVVTEEIVPVAKYKPEPAELAASASVPGLTLRHS